LALCLIAASLATGCNSALIGNGTGAAGISASSSSIRVNQQLQLTPTQLRPGDQLIYSVNGVLGGNDVFGTVSATGLYTAPAVVPTPYTVTITATSTVFPTATPGSVSVQVWNPIPVLNSVTPSSFTEGTTVVQVNGSQFVYGAQVSWNGALLDTTYVSSTQLVATVSAPNPGTFPLTVTNPNPGSASANPISVTVGPGQVVLKLDTSGGTDVRVSNSITLGLTVNGTNNTGVTLAVNGVANGNAQWGTAAINNGLITYTAPAVVPTQSTVISGYPNIVQLTVVSQDNPTVAIAQNISVMNPIPILQSVNPSSFSATSSTPPTVTLTGTNFISGATVLVNGAAATTTFIDGGHLSAPVNISELGNLDLQVLNPAPGPAASEDLIVTVGASQPPYQVVQPADAARFLEHATFGATDADIRHLSTIGYQAWLTEQFNTPQTPAEPAVEEALIVDNPPCAVGDVTCNAALFVQNTGNENLVQAQFWQQALTGKDELRERVKYALTQLFVISSNNSTTIQDMPRGEASYYDMLGAETLNNDNIEHGVFSNFHTILQDVTLSPMMGQFLNMLGNDKGNATTDPDENYAREVMQLFTIGLWQLNDDGSQKLDTNLQPIPTYSNSDVMGLAAVFTGFSWNVPGNTTDTAWSSCCIYVGTGFGEELLPMQSYPSHHSTGTETVLGQSITLSDPNTDLNTALNIIFNHPNLPAFFAKQMIQHLVTSNPSPAYISRVAQTFEGNGQYGTGVRGDMKAVITAILLDPEAQTPTTDASVNMQQYGKVREPLLRYTEWARAFTAQSRTGSFNLASTEDPIYGLGEMWLRSPTVFNWFSPGYTPPSTTIATDNLLAPEMQITNVSTVVGFINYMQNAIGATNTQGPDVFSNYTEEMQLAGAQDLDPLMDRINLLLMAGQMTSTMYTEIEKAVSSIPLPTNGDPAALAAAELSRVQTAIYLTVASPDFAAEQ
jgi:uncharacterized protein (DUF1800 family)